MKRERSVLIVSSFLFHRGLKCSQLSVLLALIFIPIFLAGCGTLRNNRGWGQDVTFKLELKGISRAAYHALFDLQTLIPTAGALVFAINDFDKKVSNWASDHHPIFGSKDNALKASDYLLIPLYAETCLTALVTPSGDDPKNWAYWKMKGIVVEGLALGATGGMTSLLKEATNRNRPDRSNDKSFPSGHSSDAFANATLSNRNLNVILLPKEVRLPVQVGNILLATSVAWARVEAKKHYPSDVLAGAALGHFISAFVHDAFIGLPQDNRVSFTISPLKRGAMAELYVTF
jgi:membrane-associated phospholipid phosphatase